MKLKKANIRFIDSINFTLQPLSSFPTTFGFEGCKGYFPHLFNTNANQRYKGKFPELYYYGYNEMTKDKKEKLKQWHEEQTHTFRFKSEMFKYCLADVEILARGCIFKYIR